MQSVLQSLVGIAGGFDSMDDKPPGDPRTRKFEGPWLQQQLVLSIGIGVFCFVLFSLIRRKSPALFAPRTKLKGFTSHTKGIDDGIFSWIWPTIKTEEIRILHMVGLDAAILLSFFKMSFWIFFFLSLWCVNA
jgi:xanthosine utilization system XapX-like protein